MIQAYIGLGTNLGDRYKNLESARKKLNSYYEINIVKAGSIKKTEPVDYTDQPDFLNQMIQIETDLKPELLLHKLKKIEKEMGRQNKIPKGPRIIDLDIIFYDNLILKTKNLTIPHSEFKNRAFIIESLIELDPDIKDPVSGTELKSML